MRNADGTPVSAISVKKGDILKYRENGTNNEQDVIVHELKEVISEIDERGQPIKDREIYVLCTTKISPAPDGTFHQLTPMLTQAAECHTKTGSSSLEACNSYVEAGNSYEISNHFAAFKKAEKYENASALFTKAGNAYKLANAHDRAGEAFTQAAECYKKTGSSLLEACNSYVEAGNSYEKSNPIAAVQAYEKAIDMYNEAGIIVLTHSFIDSFNRSVTHSRVGRFNQSGRFYKEIAEIYEKDGNTELAMKSYQEAANMFEIDNMKSAASQCIAKVAN